MTTTRLERFSRFVFAILLIGVMAAPTGQAQEAPRDSSPDPEGEVIVLSPFIVTSTEEPGYQATHTLAGTRLNTSLKDVGAAVSVYTAEFLEDINVTKIEDILTYTASTEGGGMGGNYAGIASDNSAEVRDDPSGVNRVRALAQATRTRDYFPSDIPSDGFSFDSVTISRGPNAILAGVGNAGGVIDAAMRKATFKDSYRVVSRFGQHESHREELHLNKVIIPNRLAIRLALMNDDQNFRQAPAYAKDKRLYAAMTYRLFDPKRSSFFGRGTLRANFEKGEIEGVPPDPLTPVANLSSWFVDGDPLLTNWYVNGATRQFFNSAGTVIQPNTLPAGAQGFPLYRQWALIYADPNSGAAGVGFADADLQPVQGFIGTVLAGSGNPGGFLRGTGDRNRQRAGYFRTHLSDPNIFNFYDSLLTGAFDYREQEFDATDIRYEQLMLDGRAGFEAAYNFQSFTRTRDLIFNNGDEADVYIDVNKFLSIRSAAYPNGIPNPNFGRPFIHTQDAFSDQLNRTERESYQLTAFFRHDFTKSDSRWMKWLGRHTLSALAFKTDITKQNRTYHSTWDPAGQLNPTTSTGAAPGAYAAQVNAWFYVGPSVAGLSSASDVRLQPITTDRPQFGETYTLRVYDPVTRTFVTGTSSPLRILSRVVDQKETVESEALALQSHFLKDHIVTTVGWREDRDDTQTSGIPPTLPDGGLDESQITFQPIVNQSKRSWTKSVVGLLPIKLPGDTEIRGYWNESSNYNPVGQRRNIWNEELGSPTASTEEYGVTITTFNGRLSLRINHYETSIKNDAISGVRNPYTYISTMIGRALGAEDLDLDPADWNYPGFSDFGEVALAFYETIPQRLKDNIGADRNFNPRFTGSGATLGWEPDSIVNLASISDTVSEGMEYEAIVNPTRNWRISLSLAKNEAVKSGVAGEELAFAAAWRSNLETMYGGNLLRGHRSPGTAVPNPDPSFWAQYNTEHLAPIRTSAALSGTASPEIRKWRANLVTNYQFRDGFLRGFNISGAVRWQDRIGIGYPYVTNEDGNSVADITNPYWGPKETAYDASLGYTRKLKLLGTPVTWRLNLNVRNIGAKDEIIPISANADGSYGTFRIAPEQSWSVTNSFAF